MLLAGALGFFSRSWLDEHNVAEPRQITGEQRPPLRLPDLSHVMRDLSEWDGQVILLNFWASWCAPCRQEIPELIALQAEFGERGLQVVGVAVDNRTDASEFAEEYGINYPVLIVDWLEAAAYMQEYGNPVGTLPYTVIIDRKHRVTFVHQGPLLRGQIVAELTVANL